MAELDITPAGGSTYTGTANQVIVTGTVLSTPQDIATTSNPQFATIELGHASDTTLSRVSAGVVNVEGVRVITSSGTTSNTILKNNGTTFVASTETYAAPSSSGNVMRSDGTNWTSGTPYFQQKIPIALSTLSEGVGCGSNTDGSVIYVMTRNITELRRFARNSAGTYIETHSANVTTAVPNTNWGGVIVIGSYVYVFFSDTTNIICKRYLAADLTGEQAMTVPTVSCTANCAAWTDGTDAYVVSNNTDTTSRRWTLSGTTFTAASTATITSGIFTSVTAASFWNGTNAYIAKKSTATPNVYTLYKLTSIDGSATTSSTFNMYKVSDDDIGIVFAPISSTLAYVGPMATTYNATAAITTNITLFPIALP